jgi:DUF4097 and DUF4098 domain-containing protein YvlB
VSRRSILVLATLFAAITSAAYADEWKKTFTTSGRPEVRVNTNDASIEVRATDRKDTEIRIITKGFDIPGKLRITDNQSGDTISLEVHRPSHGLHVSWGDKSTRVEIEVPREANLDLHSGDGHISVDDVKGDLRLDTSDGHIDANNVDGKLHARTSDGHMTIDGRFDDLELGSSDGHIEAVVRPGSVMNNDWNVETSDGRVDVRIPETMNADIDLHTGDGRVTSEVPLTISGETGRSNVQGKLNAGGFMLRIHTSDGGIYLGKA